MTMAERKSQGARVGKVAPHNLEAEESLLGAMLLSNEAIADAIEICHSLDFYKPSHQHIFDSLTSLWNKGEPIDTVTVAEDLKRKNLLAEIGGAAHLLALQANTPSIGNASSYARIISDNALLRKGIRATTEIAETAYSVPEDVEQWVDWAEGKIFDLHENRSSDSIVSIDQSMGVVFEEFKTMAEHPGEMTGIPTGYTDLDNHVPGLQASNLTIVGARPGMGKTAFALGVAANVAIKQKVPVLLFSLEMSHGELTKRILSAEGQIDGIKMRNGKWGKEDVQKLSRARANLAGAPIYIDDSPNVTVMDIRARARRVQAKQGLGLIVVDYLQLMSGRGRGENRQSEVAEISRGLKVLARELDVPVVALSQLSRNLEMRTDKRPMLSDLRESGSLEQDADVVLFIYRDELYNPDSKDAGIAEIIVAKQRAGATGMIRLAFMDSFTKFANLTSQVNNPVETFTGNSLMPIDRGIQNEFLEDPNSDEWLI